MRLRDSKRAPTLERLTAQVERSRFRDASQIYDALIDEIPSDLPYPDGTVQLKASRRSDSGALCAHISQAVRRLNDFVRTGIEDV